jgi:primosomal protein N' (replication factor Y)
LGSWHGEPPLFSTGFTRYYSVNLSLPTNKPDMTQALIIRLALPTPLRRLFDYLPPQGVDPKALIPGVRVQVPFQSRVLVGILVDVVATSAVPVAKLKRATALLDDEPILPPDIAQLCQWAADYYHYALGEVLAAALPVALRKGKPASAKMKPLTVSEQQDQQPVMNEGQQKAVDAICAAKKEFRPFLLDGVTGSGKTEVYLRSMTDMLQDGKQVLVLVPEISLTPQTIERFRERFSVPVVALHSGLTELARLKVWLAAKSGEAKIVIGTRSAVFTPFAKLGLIIVDEEHDTSFKQQDRFRYHARDLAVMRASINHIPIVLGSATPSLESLLNVKRERYDYLTLRERAGNAQLPAYEMINLRQSTVEEGLSTQLVKTMRHHLEQGNQVMLFLNRRGYAPVLYCTECTWIAGCRRCDTRMVYHHKPPRLQCHHCDSRSNIPVKCAQCGAESLQPVGIGTQRLEKMLQKNFPDVPIIRVDRDSTQRKGAMQDLLTQIHAEPKAILLGTQMLAKGHHFPNVTLVGVVETDSGLFSADFRAAEQMGQLLLQVSGRAGRAEKPGTVMIQTHHPDHALLRTLIHEGYKPFADALLSEREQALLPPYSYFAVFRAEAYTNDHAQDFLTKLKDMCKSTKDAITVLGPVPALLAKRKGLHCQHLIIKSPQRGTLQRFLKMILQEIEKFPGRQPVKWVLDVDPVEVV